MGAEEKKPTASKEGRRKKEQGPIRARRIVPMGAKGIEDGPIESEHSCETVGLGPMGEKGENRKKEKHTRKHNNETQKNEKLKKNHNEKKDEEG